MEILLGIDIGSTTVKIVLLQGTDILYKKYDRHYSKVREKTSEMILEMAGCNNLKNVLNESRIKVSVTGSAGLGLAKASGLDFVQEVFATRHAVGVLVPKADVVIELGGEDAKIIFLTGIMEERMNGTCAGGTGAFIDQMSVLLNVTGEELDILSEKSEIIYSIASRCGVFAKTDIQTILNQGARKEDIAMSIFQAVVDQTLSGLAQGRDIEGDVLFLGGPLHFYKGLQKRFIETLGLRPEHAHFPEIGPYAIAAGAAYHSRKNKALYSFEEIIDKTSRTREIANNTKHLPRLFNDMDQYREFVERHSRDTVESAEAIFYKGKAYLGIDCGSTTTKIVLISEDNRILYQYYSSNKGNPVQIVRHQLEEIYDLCEDRITIESSGVTGYGEDLIKNAFGINWGIVETVAHYIAAKHFCPDVDFIIDIGGQDMKCFKIKDGRVDNIMLNEACSSGCGSFVETFAKSMGHSVEEFCTMGVVSKQPIDLGSRCTVFMNSSVKQAQKEGASMEDISAGLSISVVKNALYKVVRINSADELGENIVVQGGTFLNDAILRSFEKEIERNVIRPSISGLMGAFGVALYSKERVNSERDVKLISRSELKTFGHSVKNAKCGLCTNNCNLNINIFENGGRYISGNRCEKPLGKAMNREIPDMYQHKLDKLRKLIKSTQEKNQLQRDQAPRIGIPLVLNMIEQLPAWNEFFSSLGFKVVISDVSSREIYRKGQRSIPSDTVCYPAKLVHGHIENLIEKGCDAIFYPCMTYNIDENKGDNCYNCPVVAYYPELVEANIKSIQKTRLIKPYIELNNKAKLKAQLFKELKAFKGVSRLKISRAIDSAFSTQKIYEEEIYQEGLKCIEYADNNNLVIAVVAGRPYHIDPEINHGINQLIASCEMVVITEDVAARLAEVPQVNVLNQWTYHSRMYASAAYVKNKGNAQMIQLVSFGCGIDSITSDEIRAIVEENGKIYTQLKIDEINNLGAARIRIRSLKAAIDR
ncbi:acyl-CoA dehydratase activase [Proteocatella sphenisci]|uniref:acyl-CoA dehydratase activase n=1 Tax=Proteocatella sphenisci TaxID=181070 RepID=UPI0004B62FE8|nr:acyl-CoA dehydratase activase [Proteocatella sphenisci]